MYFVCEGELINLIGVVLNVFVLPVARRTSYVVVYSRVEQAAQQG